MDFWFSNLIRRTAVVDDARVALYKERFTVMDEVLAAAHQLKSRNSEALYEPSSKGCNVEPGRIYYHVSRPGSSFQTLHEGGRLRGRTEIAPDQREKFLQRFQQQNPLLQQFNSQSSSGLGGPPPASPNTATSAQQKNLIHLQSSQQMSTGSKDSANNNSKVDEIEQQQQQIHQQSVTSDDSIPDPAQSPVLNKNTSNEEDLNVSYALDMQQGSGTMTVAAQSTRDVDLSPGQPLQSNQSVSLCVIGRRILSDLGAIGDNVSGLAVSLGGTHDQQYNLQMLESAFYKLPQPRDSERPKIYTAPFGNVLDPTTLGSILYFLHLLSIECLSTLSGCKRIKETIMERQKSMQIFFENILCGMYTLCRGMNYLCIFTGSLHLHILMIRTLIWQPWDHRINFPK
ncbi:unnamed protein product [Lactuca virosa]|uniref:Uncharacterized protein n=1 Tax=Lactuca virosa TaxID=75947 RepID=A0AAU9N8S5_9ASTR|nr:unnamed protein product [Lactuca virosa]